MSGASPLWFLAVGGAAALVHYVTVRALVAGLGLAPLLANPIAWCVAFGVSFVGHRHLSFALQAAPMARSLRRFAVLSLAGLFANQAAYAALLRFTPLRYDVALVLVLAGVAGATYVLGRHWAFAGNRSNP